MDDETLRDLLQDFGPVSIRRMFGGKGIYHQGLIFALVVRDELLFKADELTAPQFVDAGSVQWTFEGRKGGEPIAMPYWSVPSEAFDDLEIMTKWARLAYEAALRSEKAKPKKKSAARRSAAAE
ncbi:DNA transformation protein [Ochrobactrum daejeonense]|uniref:DNA transformation protein n=1 Tax=Brucella daejeonensis TaxID=659015 RepID=A0A7W9AWJ9_9HYPH|nr:TfoX/Sxy family protein [Brucella daejeonensis]MBB5701913.1 DNA transformation protein [Brucella daejeonensis]